MLFELFGGVNIKDFRKEYIDYEVKGGYPVGSDLFYECTKCSEVISSNPRMNTTCKCKNIVVDVSSARLIVKSPKYMKIFRKHLNKTAS